VKGFPDERDAVARPGGWSDLPMFSAPLPSGPQTPVPRREENRRAAYQAWKRSEPGGQVFGWMLMESRKRLLDGAKRIGVKDLFEDARKLFPGSLNNSFTGMVATDLVLADARLLPLIERRVRKARR
jgi:hypothetical protein